MYTYELSTCLKAHTAQAVDRAGARQPQRDAESQTLCSCTGDSSEGSFTAQQGFRDSHVTRGPDGRLPYRTCAMQPICSEHPSAVNQLIAQVVLLLQSMATAMLATYTVLVT